MCQNLRKGTRSFGDNQKPVLWGRAQKLEWGCKVLIIIPRLTHSMKVRGSCWSIYSLKSHKPGHQSRLFLAERSMEGNQTDLTWSSKHWGWDDDVSRSLHLGFPEIPSAPTCPKFIPPAPLCFLFSILFIVPWAAQSLRLKLIIGPSSSLPWKFYLISFLSIPTVTPLTQKFLPFLPAIVPQSHMVVAGWIRSNNVIALF